MEQIRKIILFGAGNVASHLSKALVRKGFSIVQLVNRSPESGRQLAVTIGARFAGTLEEVVPDADLYILAVSDAAIPEIAASLRVQQGIVVHTSGSVNMDVLRPSSGKIGVFYPLQTFRKGKRISFNRVPICVEANRPGVEEALLQLAGQLSSNVHRITSEQRHILHLTAIFAGNFTNYLYAIAEDLLIQYGIPFELLKPLIHQTAANARHADLYSLQTGPAIRDDRAVIENHLELLKDHPVYREIYELITHCIIRHKNQHGKL
ncbi:MAG: DUF2520 domain-containing protein [Bacteroidetes bacterium]|nr:MAG: DUF2520 domain-containing protein [Bacteroidota bacterium]